MAKDKFRPFYAVVDTETSGLVGKVNAITEIGILIVDPKTLEDMDAFSTHIKPYNKVYDPRALSYTNMTLDFLEKEGVPVKEAANNFANFLNKWLPSKKPQDKLLIIGHNIQFDIQMLKPFFEENGLNYSDYFQERYSDTLVMCNQMYDHIPDEIANFKLGTCAEKVGVEATSWHNAMDDIYATADIFKYCTKKLRSSGGNSEAVEKQERFRANFKF